MDGGREIEELVRKIRRYLDEKRIFSGSRRKQTKFLHHLKLKISASFEAKFLLLLNLKF